MRRELGMKQHQMKDIVQQIQTHQEKQRQLVEDGLPKVRLERHFVHNCDLLLNRAELLDRLPKGGVVAELGVDHAKFSREIIKRTMPSRLHLVDVWQCERYHERLFYMISNLFAPQIESGSVVIERKLSTEAAHDYPDAYFDWIYIDTDHSYRTTRAELELYAPKIKPGGLIAGHDYSKGNFVGMYRYGVIEAVHEFCNNYGWEFVFLTFDPFESQSFAIRKIAN